MDLLRIDDEDDDVLFSSDALREINPGAHLHRHVRPDAALDDINGRKLDQPDIIFIDINMPMINGWECLRQLAKVASAKRFQGSGLYWLRDQNKP